MPKYRQLHTKIIDSFDFNEMPDDFTRIFWILLMVIADSEGRAIDNPAWIRSRMFPLRDDVTVEQIENALFWLQNRKLIIRYQVSERSYFQIVNFKKYQSGTRKEAQSLFPSPDILRTNSGLTPDEVGVAESASASVFESEYEYESEYKAEEPENIYRIYEQEIGPLSPMLGDMLDEIDNTYPKGWFKKAVATAKECTTSINLKYVEAILKRWKSQGFSDYGEKNNGKPKVSIDETGRINI